MDADGEAADEADLFRGLQGEVADGIGGVGAFGREAADLHLLHVVGAPELQPEMLHELQSAVFIDASGG